MIGLPQRALNNTLHDAAHYVRALKYYLYELLDLGVWHGSVVGKLFRVSIRHAVASVIWWVLFLGAMFAVAGARGAIVFAALWFGARATTYHGIKVLTEISDHGALVAPRGVVFSRNMPDNILTPILHPHGDSYHLLHHLFPRAPMARLGVPHELILRWPEYQPVQNIESYFFGPSSFVCDWVSPPCVRDQESEAS